MKLHNQVVEALSSVRSGQRVFIHGACATPAQLIKALVERAPNLLDVELVHLHTMGPVPFAAEELRKSFKVKPFFIGANMRKAATSGLADYRPCFLSEIPKMMRTGRVPIDIALIHVSPPDNHGYCTLGVSVDIARAAVDCGKTIIAQINAQMPRVHGDGFIHIDQIHHAVEINEPIIEEKQKQPTDEEKKIAQFVVSLVEDGSTIQVGIGSIPDATMSALKQHQHLGIHTETWTDGALDLILSGAVDNSKKKLHPGCTVSGFVMGSRRQFDFIHDNPSVLQLDIGYINNPINIARNPKVVAINSAVEIDLTGQVCADSIGPRIISGAGGQMDFIRGASISEGGKPIIALTARTKSGASRIVPMLRLGAGVVTTRAHVHFVVTEYGIADLYGKSLSERAKALIAIAHPADRDILSQAVASRAAN